MRFFSVVTAAGTDRVGRTEGVTKGMIDHLDIRPQSEKPKCLVPYQTGSNSPDIPKFPNPPPSIIREYHTRIPTPPAPSRYANPITTSNTTSRSYNTLHESTPIHPHQPPRCLVVPSFGFPIVCPSSSFPCAMYHSPRCSRHAQPKAPSPPLTMAQECASSPRLVLPALLVAIGILSILSILSLPPSTPPR